MDMNKDEFEKAIRKAKRLFAYVRINEKYGHNLEITKTQAREFIRLSESTALFRVDVAGDFLYIG